MDLMQIKGFHRIDGESRMPSVTEDTKFPKWNNATGAFEYVTILDLHVSDVTQEGDIVTITMSDGNTYPINITGYELELPGITKVLYDADDVIGGSSQFTYDYTNHRLIFTDSQGIFGRVVGKDGVTPQNIVQYLGYNSLYLNYGNVKAAANGIDNNTFGRDALANTLEGDNNIAIGKLAGRNAGNTSSDNVFIGSYAGRIEPGDNKLYIHNADFTTLQEFKDGSLLYGEFDNGILYINNRLSVREEVRIGTFDIGNTPLGGMVQFVDAANPALLKPQYYDNTQWVDFANSTDIYLDGITNVGTEWTFSRTGAADIIVTIPDTSYPSHGNQYVLQLSNGDDSFISTPLLNWDSVRSSLVVNSGLRLPTQVMSNYSPIDGLILNNGIHLYGYINGAYRQLDNDESDGQVNEGENIGTEAVIYAGMNPDNHNLQFYTLKNGIKIDIEGGDLEGNVTINVDYDVYGSSLGAIGQSIYVDTTNIANDSILNFKRLFSSDSSVAITSYANYLDLTVTGAPGSGEVNTGENVGLGTGRIWDEVNEKNGLNILFRTLLGSDNISISTDTTDQVVEFTVPNFINNITDVGTGVALIKDFNTASGKINANLKTLVGLNGIYIDNSTDNNSVEISIDSGIEIPAITGNLTPNSTNLDKTLTWYLTHDVNILDATAAIDENIVQLNLGSNLIYNSATNTLDSIGSSGNPLVAAYNNLIIRNVDGSVDRAHSNRNVVFQLENGNIVIWDGTTLDSIGLGWLAFENDYPIASDTIKGILEVDTSGILNITNGVLSADAAYNLNIYVDDIEVVSGATEVRLEAGDNVTLTYDGLSGNIVVASTGAGTGGYPDLNIDGILVEEDIQVLDVIAGDNMSVTYQNPGGVVISALPYFPPYTHIPDAFIAFNNNLYTYDISEGTAQRVINAPNALWNTNGSFGEGDYIFTSSGTTLFRYTISTDITDSVQAANNEIKYIVNGSDGVYVICTGRCYFVDKVSMLASDYGSTMTTATPVGAKEITNTFDGFNYIAFVDQSNDRWHYKMISSQYGGLFEDNWSQACASVSNLLIQNTSSHNGRGIALDVDNYSYVYEEFSTMIGGNCAKTAYYTYDVPSGHTFLAYGVGQSDAIYTIEVSEQKNSSTTPTAYALVNTNSATGYDGSIDKGIYVSKSNNPYNVDYGFEQAVNADVRDLHVEYIPYGGLFNFGVNVIVGGSRPTNGISVIGQVHFHSYTEDSKQFTTKDVYEVDYSATHATIVEAPITFVYFDSTYTANSIPPKDITVITAYPIEDIAFDFNDVTGVTQTYILDIEASYNYTILEAVLQSDDIVAVTIDIDATTVITDNVTTAIGTYTSGDSVTTGSQITLNLGTSSATLIRGKLRVKRI